MIENTNTKQFYPGPILNNTLEITDFLFNDAEQIKIKHSKLNEEGILIDVDLNYPIDYEVTKVLPSDINAAEAALTASTGQIMLKNVNVLAGEKLTVYRVSLIIQDKDYPRTGAFPAATHEGALDYLTMQNQEQKDEIDRALKVPISTQNFEGSLPLPIPSRALKINNDGTGFEMSEFDPDLALVITEEFKNQSQQAAAEALTLQNVATQQATIATQQAGIATEKTAEVVESGTIAVQNIDTAFNAVSEWFRKLNAIPYIPVGTILPTTGAIDESLGYQRYANGQLIANVSSQAPDLVKFLEFQEAHAPNLLCSETEWQTSLTLSTLGQVGKYVWNKEEDSVRIPRIVNIQGMMDMNNVGNMIEAGLPNITGSWDTHDRGYNAGGYTSGALRNGSFYVDTIKYMSQSSAIGTYNGFYFDASRSSTVYGNSDTVQEESILYPYVLQIATGVQYKTPVQNELERIVPYSFGNYKYSNVLLNNPAWMRSVGQWNSAKTHGDYYNWLAEEKRNPKDIPARANVTKVGNVIDEGGVLSGFSSSNYALSTKIPTNVASYEICTKFTITSAATVNQQGIFASSENNRCTPQITYNLSDGVSTVCALHPIDRDTWTDNLFFPVEVNKTYYVKIIWDGSLFSMYYKEDESDTWILAGQIEVTTIYWTQVMGIGINGFANYYPFSGSIDLNGTYINIDGQRWWSGMKSPVRLHTEDYGPEDWVINQSEQTFRLPLVADRVLVDKVEGTKSYDLYSDGYLEQLVHVADSGSTYDFTVHLPKAYKDLSFAASGLGTYTNDVNHQGQIAIKEKTCDTLLLSSAGLRNDDATVSSMGTNVNITIHTAGYTEIPTEEQRTMNKYLYFYVGGVAKNEHLVDVGRIEETLVDKANKSDVDGQWVHRSINLCSNLNVSSTSTTYDVSNYLPNDGYIYEVIGNLFLTTGTASGNTVKIKMGTDIMNSHWVAGIQTRSGSAVINVAQIVMIVGNGRKIGIQSDSTDVGKYSLQLTTYRRIGTNL